MITNVAQTALLVREYDEAKRFYCDKLGFSVVEDTELSGGKRWVRLRAPGRQGSELLLSRAVDDKQKSVIGNQAGGRVLFFFHTNDFDADYKAFRSRGVEFMEDPRDEVYAKVAVLKDLYGNRIDLIQPKSKGVDPAAFERTYSKASWETEVGYCRALRAGDHIYVTGTASVAEGGGVHVPGDGYAQAKRCLEIIEKALKNLGSDRTRIVRTRMFVTDIVRWPEFGKAHREFFGEDRPTTTMVEVKSLIDPAMLIEIEADAVDLK
jgi:isochorismate pyruvate lyase